MDKSIEERLKEILEIEEEKKDDSDFWLLILFMLMIPTKQKEQPIINIYLGSEKDV